MKEIKYLIITIIPIVILLLAFYFYETEGVNFSISINMGMFLLTYITVVFTYESLQKARKESYLESRPYLIADFDNEEETLFFYVQNIGKTSALDVKISISPDLNIFDQISFNKEVFKEKINFFPPGKTIKTNINTTSEFHQKNEAFTLTLIYKDSVGKKIKEDIYMNLKYRRHLLYQKRKKIDDVVKSLNKIGKAINDNSI
ncbi:hypothetical protein [Anditalea andensis]|uniref:Uncharacterized protein n=1 Tax=Anditalea andensis TaxID=1048983 RepID=A0A074KTL3_9BACT|nr:hypothetical protein [Anditalea andensis]KEO72239.1 hypothetical protein EL17_18740 [Anditalea andensis]